MNILAKLHLTNDMYHISRYKYLVFQVGKVVIKRIFDLRYLPSWLSFFHHIQNPYITRNCLSCDNDFTNCANFILPILNRRANKWPTTLIHLPFCASKIIILPNLIRLHIFLGIMNNNPSGDLLASSLYLTSNPDMYLYLPLNIQLSPIENYLLNICSCIWCWNLFWLSDFTTPPFLFQICCL